MRDDPEKQDEDPKEGWRRFESAVDKALHSPPVRKPPPRKPKAAAPERL